MEITGVSRPQEISPDISSDALEAFDCEVPVLNDWLRSRVFLSEKFSGRSTYVVREFPAVSYSRRQEAR